MSLTDRCVLSFATALIGLSLMLQGAATSYSVVLPGYLILPTWTALWVEILGAAIVVVAHYLLANPFPIRFMPMGTALTYYLLVGNQVELSSTPVSLGQMQVDMIWMMGSLAIVWVCWTIVVWAEARIYRYRAA